MRVTVITLVAGLSVLWNINARAQDRAAHGNSSSEHDHGSIGHRAMDHEAVSEESSASAQDPGLPPITDADRAAAFPGVGDHPPHADKLQFLILADQLEWQDAKEGDVLNWDIKGWVGRDLRRIQFRAEGEREDEITSESEAHLLLSRRVARWWELVGGVRQDFEPGSAQSWLAVGVQGLAPYKFEVEATAYLGEGGQSTLRLEAEYELLLTNRLILQPLLKIDVYGKDDRQRGIGSGLSSVEGGLRLRYELRREFAPYLGVIWTRAFGDTADLAELADEDLRDTRLVAGVRVWF